ncbi:MAG: conjugal transfer protein TraF [Armatimonadetes bacterium]|nr:conjugal transfer protein TraF [Armatimonadota bacterium]
MLTKLSAVLLAVCATLALPRGAAADFASGAYARQLGMGGAGLALIDQASSTQYLNPAALAFTKKKLGFNFPSGTIRFDGVSFSTASDLRRAVLDQDQDDIIESARRMARREATVDASFVSGLTFYKANLGYEGQGRVQATPDSALMSWANGPQTTPPTGTSRIRAASVVSAPSIAVGSNVPWYKGGRLAVGARVRFQQLSGQTREVTFDNGNASVADLASEHRNGVAADVGFVLRPQENKGIAYGLVVNDLIHPHFQSYEQRTMISGGIAKHFRPGLVAAADAVNITNAYGDGVDLRAGIEYKPLKFFALRTGLSTHRGWTVGVQLAGFNFAWAADAPMVLSQTLRF